MIKLEKLTAAVAAESEHWRETRGIVCSVHSEVSEGRFVHVHLGSTGLSIFNGEACVGIPLADILELAGRYDPRLAPQPAAKEESQHGTDSEMGRK